MSQDKTPALFRKILIANRGEIAVRVIRAAKALGIRSVAVFSAADRSALHARLADECHELPGNELASTYLDIERIIRVAKACGAEAIHPGYGFMSENVAFVEACQREGITFIGPNPKAIRLMGNKVAAREFVRSIGVPLTQGHTGEPGQLIEAARGIAFPILVKAAAGGGGKGMRIVRRHEELQDAIETTSREALNYFGDGQVYIEQFIENPRHVELQIIGDEHGNLRHLYERECSIQRRYQKIIEESPSPTLDPATRERMAQAALRIGQAIGYTNAGTIEFLVDARLNFYFLEMNTRIQVEHPVTEMVTGIDIAQEQIRVAAGFPISFAQEQVRQHGHAIECRVYAEDPGKGFAPSPGPMRLYAEPAPRPGLRVDSAFEAAGMVHSFYDPMISKMIAWGPDREQARQLARESLGEFAIHGIRTNLAFLQSLLDDPRFVRNQVSTNFCDQQAESILASQARAEQQTPPLPAALAFVLHDMATSRQQQGANLWQRMGHWRDIPRVPIRLDQSELELEFEPAAWPDFRLRVGQARHAASLRSCEGPLVRFVLDGVQHQAHVSPCHRGTGQVSLGGLLHAAQRLDVLCPEMDYGSAGGLSGDPSRVSSPMNGKVVKLNVAVGDAVVAGQTLLVVEAMKMENQLKAEIAGTVAELNVRPGQMVEGGALLVRLEA